MTEWDKVMQIDGPLGPSTVRVSLHSGSYPGPDPTADRSDVVTFDASDVTWSASTKPDIAVVDGKAFATDDWRELTAEELAAHGIEIVPGDDLDD